MIPAISDKLSKIKKKSMLYHTTYQTKENPESNITKKKKIRKEYLALLRINAIFSTSDMLTRVFLLMTLPRSSSTVLSRPL